MPRDMMHGMLHDMLMTCCMIMTCYMALQLHHIATRFLLASLPFIWDMDVVGSSNAVPITACKLPTEDRVGREGVREGGGLIYSLGSLDL